MYSSVEILSCRSYAVITVSFSSETETLRRVGSHHLYAHVFKFEKLRKKRERESECPCVCVVASRSLSLSLLGLSSFHHTIKKLFTYCTKNEFLLFSLLEGPRQNKQFPPPPGLFTDRPSLNSLTSLTIRELRDFF